MDILEIYLKKKLSQTLKQIYKCHGTKLKNGKINLKGGNFDNRGINGEEIYL